MVIIGLAFLMGNQTCGDSILRTGPMEINDL